MESCSRILVNRFICRINSSYSGGVIMIEYKGLQFKKVLVLGLAKSGVAAAELLHKLGAFVTVNDAKPFDANPEAQGLLVQGITVICGRHPEELLDEGFELVVKNPGI